jgi:hypothetical protein
MNIGLTTFEWLKPWFVWRLKEWNNCCKYHIEMEELHKGFNTMKIKGKGVHVNCTCSCDICGPKSDYSVLLHIFEGVTSLWQSIVCPKGLLDENYKLDYLNY